MVFLRFELMKKLLAIGVMSLTLVSCGNADEMKIQCSIHTSLISSGELKKKAQDYIASKTGLASTYRQSDAFCKSYLN